MRDDKEGVVITKHLDLTIKIGILYLNPPKDTAELELRQRDDYQ